MGLKHLLDDRKKRGFKISGNTEVELKEEDRLMKHQADTVRQHLHQVCFN